MMRCKKTQWASIAFFLLAILTFFNLLYMLATVRNPRHNKNLEQASRYGVEINELYKLPPDKNGKTSYTPEISMCSFRSTARIDGKTINLNLEPFRTNTNSMECFLNGALAVFGKQFAVLSNAILDPSKTNHTQSMTSPKGGEKLEEVFDQMEEDEYFSPLPGYFSVPCKVPPELYLYGHLSSWAKSLRCYGEEILPKTHYLTPFVAASVDYIQGVTVALQRYEYVNFYHSMTEFYNAFILKILLNFKRDKTFNILFVDAHPQGSLDIVWSHLFSNVFRAGRLKRQTRFEKLVWGIPGHSSPLNQHYLTSVPYLEEFRYYFLSQHEVETTSHSIDCNNLRVVIVWRHDYVAHPRNKEGKVVRKFSNEDEILTTAREALGVQTASVVGVSFEKLSMKQQLSFVSSCDILMGMHGAGLSHTLFLPLSSGLVEVSPSYISPNLAHFESMARWRGLAYHKYRSKEVALNKNRSETYVRPKDVIHMLEVIRDRICSGA